MYSTDVNKSGKAKPIKVLKFQSEFFLVGGYDGLLYFMSRDSQKRIFYAALRENLEVKRRHLGWDYISEVHIFDELFSCFGEVNKQTFLLVIDLRTDTILFRRPLMDLGLNYRWFYIVPVVRERSDLERSE